MKPLSTNIVDPIFGPLDRAKRMADEIIASWLTRGAKKDAEDLYDALLDIEKELKNPHYSYGGGAGRIERGSILWRQEELDSRRRLLALALMLLGLEGDGDGWKTEDVEKFLQMRYKDQQAREAAGLKRGEPGSWATMFEAGFKAAMTIGGLGKDEDGGQEGRQEEPQDRTEPQEVQSVHAEPDAREAQDRPSGEEQRPESSDSLGDNEGHAGVGDDSPAHPAPPPTEPAEEERAEKSVLNWAVLAFQAEQEFARAGSDQHEQYAEKLKARNDMREALWKAVRHYRAVYFGLVE